MFKAIESMILYNSENLDLSQRRVYFEVKDIYNELTMNNLLRPEVQLTDCDIFVLDLILQALVYHSVFRHNGNKSITPGVMKRIVNFWNSEYTYIPISNLSPNTTAIYLAVCTGHTSYTHVHLRHELCTFAGTGLKKYVHNNIKQRVIVSFQTILLRKTMVEEQDVQERAPLDCFKQLWTDELTNLVVEQTNMYSTQQSGNCVNTRKDEMEQFIGMHIKMGIDQLPTYVLYWSQEMKYPPVDVMPPGRYQKLKKFLHFFDNMTYDKNVPDKLFKIKPVLERVRNQCLLIAPEECHAVDEQIIPSKTR